MAEETKTIPDSKGIPIHDAYDDVIEVLLADRPIIIRGGSLCIDSDDDLSDVINGNPSRHMCYPSDERRIRSIEIREQGQTPQTKNFTNRNVTIIIHYS